ncbi:Lrp/AsnC family transcriptional regulator [Sphingomonas abietis]|uniref:Lrp/AsnC family transcriptional regulator n=1 Tax=Sphingomonas abietis TaxID=3012344 RepID=A0ABY7NLI5_9SPHN|nr:Lrp/AsnC family transcriptional regulator [Sphingomonas abietis]WBO20774.1 Lrp/AsnC family transcriptional regulator [Sphingomonas abietis]
MPHTLDRYDGRILEVWQAQGDIGPVEMGTRVHLSASQCSRRMQRLRAAGYVSRVAAVLDADKLGIGVSAYVLITLRSHDSEWLEKFNARIAALDEVLECQALTGAADIILKVATRDLASFNRLLTRELLTAPEVATARSSIVLENLKSTTSLPVRYA